MRIPVPGAEPPAPVLDEEQQPDGDQEEEVPPSLPSSLVEALSLVLGADTPVLSAPAAFKKLAEGLLGSTDEKTKSPLGYDRSPPRCSAAPRPG